MSIPVFNHPRISRAREQELALLGTDAARSELIESNMALVVHIVHSKWRRAPGAVEDLISAGNFGLVTAASRFKPGLTSGFASYASFWINQKIRLHLASQNSIIRVPANRMEQHRLILLFRSRFFQEHAREPTSDEIATGLGWTRKVVLKTMEAASDGGMCVPLTYDDKIPATGLVGVDAQVRKEDLERLRGCLHVLSPRDFAILARRFGLDGQMPMTLDEIRASGFTMSRERVRQIINEALEKMRRHFRETD